MRSATLGGSSALPKFRPNQQSCIIMGGITALMIAASVGLYFWQTGEMAEMEKQIGAKQQEAATGQKTADQFETVRQDAELIESKLRYLETSVAGSMYIPTLLKQVDNLARSMNLKVQSLHHTPERTPNAPPPEASKEDKAKFKPLPYDFEHIDMEVNGDYWTVARFLYRLTTFPKILAVDTMTLSPMGATTAGSPKLGVRLNMTGFVFKDSGLPPADSGPRGPVLGSARQFRSSQREILDQTRSPKEAGK